MRRELRLLPWQSFGAFALLILLGCGGGDEKEASRRPASCPELALEAREARPLQPLAVEGLPDDFAELLAAEVLTEEGDASTTLIARAEGSDTIVLYAPIHPRGLLEGGEVSLEIIDEEGRSCPPIPFTILPLDEAPGTAEAIFERSVELVDGVARAFGTTVEELRSFEVENLPEHLLPLYLAQDSLEAPSNPNSARALLDGVAPNLDGAPLELALTDALFASIGLVEALDESLAALETLPPRDPDPTGLHGSVHQGLGRHLVATNAYQLDVDMEWADWGDLYAGENVLSEVIQDATTAIGLLGLVPHPLVKSGVLVTTTSLFAFTKAAEAAANLLPSSFVSIDFDYDPPSFFEDDDSEGQWSNVRVVARSKGWKLDQAILEALLQFTQVKGGFDDWLVRFGGPPAGLKDALADHLKTEAVAKAISLSADGSGIFSIPPIETIPIDVTEEPWSFAQLSYMLTEAGRQGYRIDPSWPVEPKGEIKVGTALGRFGGNHIFTTRTIGLDPVRILIEPSSVVVEPNEIVTFLVEVQAVDKRISVEVDHGNITHEPLPDGSHRITYAAPADEELFPDFITVTSESTGGFLSNPSRPRPKAVVSIRTSRPTIAISPTGSCVKHGESMSFTAVVENLEDSRVEWSVDFGSISADGVYLAPDQTGAATLTATSVADPSLVATTMIAVSSCACTWSIDVNGGPPASNIGDNFSPYFEGGRLKGLIFVSPLKPIAPEIAVNADLDYGPAIGETGTFPGLSGGELVSTDPTSENSGFESLDPLSIDISRFEMVGELLEIEGMVSGGIHWTYIDGELPEDERDWPGSLLLRFRGTMTKAPFPGEPQEPLFFCNPF